MDNVDELYSKKKRTPPRLMPQTITIERFIEGWLITKVAFYNPPSFC